MNSEQPNLNNKPLIYKHFRTCKKIEQNKKINRIGVDFL